jgi:hypothetical protein
MMNALNVVSEEEAREKNLILEVGSNASHMRSNMIIYKVKDYYKTSNYMNQKSVVRFICKYYLIDKHCKVKKIYTTKGYSVDDVIKEMNMILVSKGE